MWTVTPVRTGEQIVHDRIQSRDAALGIFGLVPFAIEDLASGNEPPPAGPGKTRKRFSKVQQHGRSRRNSGDELKRLYVVRRSNAPTQFEHS
jgi:hypothetical protein